MDSYFQLLLHTYEAMICCANEHVFAGYYSEESRKIAEELLNEEAEAENNGTDEGGEWIEVGAATRVRHLQNIAEPTSAAAEGNATGRDPHLIRKRKKHPRKVDPANRRV